MSYEEEDTGIKTCSYVCLHTQVKDLKEQASALKVAILEYTNTRILILLYAYTNTLIRVY